MYRIQEYRSNEKKKKTRKKRATERNREWANEVIAGKRRKEEQARKESMKDEC